MCFNYSARPGVPLTKREREREIGRERDREGERGWERGGEGEKNKLDRRNTFYLQTCRLCLLALNLYIIENTFKRIFNKTL